MLGKAWGEGEATGSHCVVPDMQEERQDARDVVYFGCSFINSTSLGTTINNLYSTGRHSFRNHSHLSESCSWPPFSHHSCPPQNTHLHSWSPARYWPPYPPKRLKGLEEIVVSSLLQISEIPIPSQFLWSIPFSVSSSSTSLSAIEIFKEQIPAQHICLMEEKATSSAELFHSSAPFPKHLIVPLCS